MYFHEREFSSIGEASRDVDFFEEEDEPAPAQEGVDPLVSGSGESNQGDGDSLDDQEPSTTTRDLPMTKTQDPRRSQPGKIFHRYHIIGGDVAMAASSYLDDVEPISINMPCCCLMLVNGKKQ